MDAANNIIKIARELGEALKNSREYAEFCLTRDAMKGNSDLKAKLDEFKVQKSVLDVEKCKDDADEHIIDVVSARLEVLYKEITSIPEMSAYTKAEENLNLLMNAVNMTISSYVGAEEYVSEDEERPYDDYEDGVEGGCTHNCATCKGCH